MKKWKNYQVEGPKGGIKTVDELTESQAKDELCKAMDLIEKMDLIAYNLGSKINDWRNGK